MSEGNRKGFSFWRWILWASPLWWFLGGIMLIYHLACAWMLMLGRSGRQESKSLYLPATVFYVISIFTVYLFSILIHASAESASRVLASGYNLSFWLMAAGLIIYFSNHFEVSDISEIYKTFKGLAAVMALLSLWAASLIFMGVRQFSFETPLFFLTRVLGDTALVKQSVTAMLLIFDWFAEAERPRFNALMPYPTATAAFIVIVIFMVVTALRSRSVRPRFFGWGMIILFCLGGLFLTFARMALFSFLLSFLIVFVIQKKHFPLWLMLILGSCIILVPVIAQGMAFFLGLREGSTTTRLDLYGYSLQFLRGAEWLIGMGIRPRDESFAFPIGSHSSYVSLLFRTGLAGLTAFLGLQGILLLRWYQLKKWVQQDREQFVFWQGLGWVFWMMLFWMLTEDIDAPQLLAFTYFSLIGIFEGFRRKVMKHAAHS